MYELHNLIEKLQERKTKFSNEYNEEEELIKVRDVLNKRLAVVREKLMDEPSNPSLLLEYGFSQEEVIRINKRLIELKDKFSTKEAQIEKYEKLISYDLQELFTYVDFIKQFKIDDKLYQAMQDSLVSLDKNIYKLNELRKEEESSNENED